MKSKKSQPSPAASKAARAMTQHRRRKIAELLHHQGAVRVGELSEKFAVSEVTIRSDLDSLEKDGLLVRDHGGAIPREPGYVTSLLRVDERAALHHEEKQRIGRAAAQRVNAGDTIILDAGTTVIEAARLIGDITPLTVITNALNVALELSARSAARVILLGGEVDREASSTVGPQAAQQVGDFVAHKLFLGAQALDLEHGITDSTSEIAQIKRAMIRAAREVILLTDSSKWQLSGFIKVAQVHEIDTIITDTALPDEARGALDRLGVEVVLV